MAENNLARKIKDSLPDERGTNQLPYIGIERRQTPGTIADRRSLYNLAEGVDDLARLAHLAEEHQLSTLAGLESEYLRLAGRRNGEVNPGPPVSRLEYLGVLTQVAVRNLRQGARKVGNALRGLYR